MKLFNIFIIFASIIYCVYGDNETNYQLSPSSQDNNIGEFLPLNNTVSSNNQTKDIQNPSATTVTSSFGEVNNNGDINGNEESESEVESNAKTVESVIIENKDGEVAGSNTLGIIAIGGSCVGAVAGLGFLLKKNKRRETPLPFDEDMPRGSSLKASEYRRKLSNQLSIDIEEEEDEEIRNNVLITPLSFMKY